MAGGRSRGDVGVRRAGFVEMTGRRLYNFWVMVRTGLWLVPTIMSVAGVALAAFALRVGPKGSEDENLKGWWFYSGSHENVRDLMSTIFSSMITMTTLVVSITMVVLTLAASQLGPRLVRNFMGDFRTQFVFGLFLMTVIYCLLVLRALDGNLSEESTPHIAATIGAFLALINLFALLIFIHNVARSIVSDTMVRRVDRDLRHAISRLLVAEDWNDPDAEAPRAREPVLPVDFPQGAARVYLPGEGYVQAIDYERLVKAAQEHEVMLRIDFRAGHFLIAGAGMVELHPGENAGPDLVYEIECAVLLGEDRTPTQDLEFSIRHLVEIAVRALSPGINDPFTAIAVVDRLGSALKALMCRKAAPDVYYDESGGARVFALASTFRGFADAAFHQIRQAGAEHPAVIIKMLETIEQLASGATLQSHSDALLHHANIISEAGRQHVSQACDLEAVEKQYDATMKALTAGRRVGERESGRMGE